MADIFLSYASEDRERIVPLARLLEGWNMVAQNNGVESKQTKAPR
jgi:hypothetical protein